MRTPLNHLASRARARGFTLIEVLATMVLLGILLPVTLRAISVSLTAASSARHLTQASALAEAKLNELVTLDQFNLATSGDFSPEYPGYRWTCQSVTRDYNVYEVMVTVYWTERGGLRQVSVTTLNPDNTFETTTEVTQ